MNDKVVLVVGTAAISAATFAMVMGILGHNWTTVGWAFSYILMTVAWLIK